jgi:hypothetical protein
MRQRLGESVSFRDTVISMLTGDLVSNVNGERSNAAVSSHVSVVVGA